MQLLQRACDLKDLEGCFELGTLQETGAPTVRSQSKALATFEQTCSAGYADSCLHIAAIYLEGRGVPADWRKGLAFDESACARSGESKTCAIVGWLLVSGQAGVVKDPKRGLALLEHAAAGSSADDKNLLAIALQQGLAGPKDPMRARALFAEACDAGVASACESEGQMLLNDEGPAASKPAALEFYEKACKLGSKTSCSAADTVQAVVRTESAIDVRKMWESYDANEVAADNQFKGKRFVSWGIIESIDKDFTGAAVVHLASPHEFAPVPVYVTDKQTDAVAKLHKRDKLYVDCVCDGKVMLSPVLRDCQIIVVN